jgi:hypothetical protein
MDAVSSRRTSVLALIAALSVGWAARLMIPPQTLAWPAGVWMALALASLLWLGNRPSPFGPAPCEALASGGNRRRLCRKEVIKMNGDRT